MWPFKWVPVLGWLKDMDWMEGGETGLNSLGLGEVACSRGR